MASVPVSLESQRERVVEALSAHYAEDHLTTQELESRFERAYRAKTADELAGIVADLPALRATPRAPQPRVSSAPPIPAAAPVAQRRQLAVMSTFRKGGNWTPNRTTDLRAVMSDVKIDLRDATFVDQEIAFDVLAVMSEVQIIVPPGVRVECHGNAVMGEFLDRSDAAAQDPTAPLVRVHGISVMASVGVETRLPGESKRAAARRRKLLRGE